LLKRFVYLTNFKSTKMYFMECKRYLWRCCMSWSGSAGCFSRCSRFSWWLSDFMLFGFL